MTENNDFKYKTIFALLWKLLENFGSQFISFIIQIILARILMPEDYSIIALAAFFIAIGNVFIETGFAPALIQKEQVDDLELSSVFFLGIIASLTLYLIIFVSAPYISIFYEQQALNLILRIQGITIIFSSIASVHNALLVRNLNFRKMFKFRIVALILQGLTGIFLAIQGYGVYALVFANIVYSLVITLSFFIVVNWRPRLMFSIRKIYKLFSFSSSILAMNLSNTVYNNIKSLIIGKSFEPELLGYYIRGIQIPTLLMVNTDGAINSVMFPVLSSYQNSKSLLLSVYRRSLKTSTYIVFPMMIGLIAVANPLISLLLTDKWLPSEPFMIISSLTLMTWPFSIKIQAFNAIGRSDLNLKLNILSKSIGIIFMIIALPYGVYAFVLSFLIASIINVLIGSIFSIKILDYKFKSQVDDIMPSLLLSSFMGIIVYSLSSVFESAGFTLLLQIIVGFILYLIGSYYLKLEAFYYLYRMVLNLIKSQNIKK